MRHIFLLAFFTIVFTAALTQGQIREGFWSRLLSPRNGNNRSGFFSSPLFTPIRTLRSRIARLMFWRYAEYPAEQPGTRMTTPELIEKAGFESETHEVTTDDGYILTTHRILQPTGLNLSDSSFDLNSSEMTETTETPEGLRRVVIIIPGLLACSDSWVLIPEKSLALVLTRLGFDVWLLNVRGCSYSKKHMTKSANDTEFWNFSWHEMGIFDLKANIDYILEKTGQEKVNLIGHSMGTTMNFVLLSEKPEYNDKINMSINLAPVSYMEHVGAPSIRVLGVLSRYLPFHMSIFSLLGTGATQELFPRTDFFDNIFQQMCADEDQKRRCISAIFSSIGFDYCQSNPEYLPWLLSYFPAGSSIWTALHYLQHVTSKTFHQFDYGPIANVIKYGQMEAPAYHLENIRAPQIMFFADNDWLTNPTDVHQLASKLPKAGLKEVCRVRIKYFNHFDFVTAKHLKTLVNDRILRVLNGDSCRQEGEDDQIDDPSITCPAEDHVNKFVDDLSTSYNLQVLKGRRRSL